MAHNKNPFADLPWPYQPTKIVVNDELTDGIISQAHAMGKQAEIASLMEMPASIMEFKEGKPQRIDSLRINFAIMCKYCKRRRENKDKSDSYRVACEESEKDFSSLWVGKDMSPASLNAIVKELNEKYKKYEERKQDKKHIGMCNVVRHPKKFYIEYTCPISGLIKFMFPIVVENKILGLLMTGQILKENSHKSESDFEIWDTDEFLKESDDADIKALHCNLKKRVRTGEAYKKITEKLIESTCVLEETLIKSLRRRRSEIITDKITEIIRVYEEDIAQRIHKENIETRSDTFWSITQKIAEQITEMFHFSFYAIYALERPSNTRMKVLERRVLYYPEDIMDFFPKSITIAGSGTKDRVFSSTGDRGRMEKILGRSVPDDVDNFNMICLNNPYYTDVGIVIFIGYPEDNPIDSDINKADGDLSGAFELFNNFLISAYTSVTALSLADIYTLHLRYQRHEISQLTTGFDGIRMTALRDYNTVHTLSHKAVDDLQSDIDDYARQISLSSEMGKYLVDNDSVQPKMRRILPYGELLVKWRKSFRIRSREMQVQIPGLWAISPSDRGAREHPPIYGNYELLEQVVYNLLTNALKNCHRGSNIAIEWEHIPNDEEWTFLTVTDYGRRIARGIDIYGLYKKGPVMNGMGLGLYIARKIVQRHGGELLDNGGKREKCVSDYHIPLLAALMKQLEKSPSRVRTYFKRWELEQYRAVYEGLERNRMIQRIVARKINNELLLYPPPERIKREINSPTYEVCFKAKLPRFKKGG